MLEEQMEMLEALAADPVVRLLPRYDNYLLGYASRAFMVAEAHAKQVHPGGGLIRACVLIDGEARAGWKLEKRRQGVRVRVSPYEKLSAAETARVAVEVEALGEFLGRRAELKVEGG